MFYYATPNDGRAYLAHAYNANTVRAYKSDPAHLPNAAAFDPRHNAIVVAERKNCLFTFGLGTSQPAQKSFTTEKISAVAVSPCGYFVVGGALESGCLLVWSAASGELLRLIKPHLGAVHHLAFSGDGSCFLSCSADSTAKVWSLAEATAVGSTRAPQHAAIITSHTRPVTFGAFVDHCGGSGAARLVATCGVDATFKITDIVSKLQVASVTLPARLTTFAFLSVFPTPSSAAFKSTAATAAPGGLFEGGGDSLAAQLLSSGGGGSGGAPSASSVKPRAGFWSALAVVGGDDGSLITVALGGNSASAYHHLAPFSDGHQGAIVALWVSAEDKFVAVSTDGKVLEWTLAQNPQLAAAAGAADEHGGGSRELAAARRMAISGAAVDSAAAQVHAATATAGRVPAPVPQLVRTVMSHKRGIVCAIPVPRTAMQANLAMGRQAAGYNNSTNTTNASSAAAAAVMVSLAVPPQLSKYPATFQEGGFKLVAVGRADLVPVSAAAGKKKPRKGEAEAAVEAPGATVAVPVAVAPLPDAEEGFKRRRVERRAATAAAAAAETGRLEALRTQLAAKIAELTAA